MRYWDMRGSVEALARAYQVPDIHPDQRNWRCEDLSRVVVQEAFHPSMLVRKRPVRPYPGGVPKAHYHWPGPISHADFTAAPTWQTSAHEVAKYKILGGRLYVLGERNPKMKAAEEMLLVAAFLYDLPDVDFAISWCDCVYDKHPVLQYSGNMLLPRWGFTYPYAPTMWPTAISLQQSLAWARCVRDQNPPLSRTPRAVWRGTTTDPFGFVSYDRFLSMARVQLHTLGLMHSDVLDVKLVKAIQTLPGVDAAVLDAILGVSNASRLSMDAFERYAAVVDVDGNGFSSRLHWLAQRNTLVLKQASVLPSYFEHLMAPGVSWELFANNLTDLPAVAARVVEAVRAPPFPNAAQAMASNMAAVAAVALSKWGMVDALAFSLAKYASKIEWQPRMEPAYSLIPFTDCCTGGNLPPEFVQAMHSAEAPVGAGATRDAAPAAPQGAEGTAPQGAEGTAPLPLRRLRAMSDGSDACVGFVPPAVAAPPPLPEAQLLVDGGAAGAAEDGVDPAAGSSSAADGELRVWHPAAGRPRAEPGAYSVSDLPLLMLCVSVMMLVATLGWVRGAGERAPWGLVRKRFSQLPLLPGRPGSFAGAA